MTDTGAAYRQPRSTRSAAAAVRDLHPAYFAFVMATGIVSIGAYMLGPRWLSDALLIAAVAGLVVLTVALAVRLVAFRSNVAAARSRRPSRAPAAAGGGRSACPTNF